MAVEERPLHGPVRLADPARPILKPSALSLRGGRPTSFIVPGLVHWPTLKASSEEEDEVHSPANLVGRALRASPILRIEAGKRCVGADVDRGLKDCMGKSISAVMLLALTLACTAAGAQEAAAAGSAAAAGARRRSCGARLPQPEGAPGADREGHCAASCRSPARRACARAGTLVRARLCHRGEGFAYVLTVLGHDGKVTRVIVDAVKGTVVGERLSGALLAPSRC